VIEPVLAEISADSGPPAAPQASQAEHVPVVVTRIITRVTWAAGDEGHPELDTLAVTHISPFRLAVASTMSRPNRAEDARPQAHSAEASCSSH